MLKAQENATSGTTQTSQQSTEQSMYRRYTPYHYPPVPSLQGLMNRSQGSSEATFQPYHQVAGSSFTGTDGGHSRLSSCVNVPEAKVIKGLQLEQRRSASTVHQQKHALLLKAQENATPATWATTQPPKQSSGAYRSFVQYHHPSNDSPDGLMNRWQGPSEATFEPYHHVATGSFTQPNRGQSRLSSGENVVEIALESVILGGYNI